MASIGNSPTQQAFTPAIDYFSGNASTTAFTLSRPVASVAQVQAVVNNVAQNPSDAFTVSGSTITFTSAPSSGTNNIYVYYTSPITQVIAPGQGTVTTTSLTSGLTLTSPVISTITNTGTLTLPTLTGTVSLTTKTVQVFTSGSGTYTTPTGCKSIFIRMIGGGGGGQGSGTSRGTGGTGGNTTFGGSLTATGGTGGSDAGFIAGGLPTGGDINIRGGSAGGASGSLTAYYPGGGGGNGAFGGGGPPPATGGNAGIAGATNTGGGGSGGASDGTSGAAAAAGGSAGGYLEKTISSPSATFSYAVGAGGTAGTGSGGSFANGGAGGSGVIIVQEFY